MTTDGAWKGASHGGCAGCLSRRGLVGAAVAAAGAAVVAGSPAHARVARWITLGNHGSMDVGECRQFVRDGRAWMVTRVRRGRYRAFQGLCTHQQLALRAGPHRILCSGGVGHDSAFSQRTGEVLHGPARRDLREYRTRIRNGGIQVYA